MNEDNFNNYDNIKTCSICNSIINFKNMGSKIPKMITVKESHELVFNKKLSLTKIYELIKTKSLPHVNARGKILLDLDKTILWWNAKLEESTKQVKLTGLKKIV